MPAIGPWSGSSSSANVGSSVWSDSAGRGLDLVLAAVHDEFVDGFARRSATRRTIGVPARSATALSLSPNRVDRPPATMTPARIPCLLGSGRMVLGAVKTRRRGAGATDVDGPTGPDAPRDLSSASVESCPVRRPGVARRGRRDSALGSSQADAEHDALGDELALVADEAEPAVVQPLRVGHEVAGGLAASSTPMRAGRSRTRWPARCRTTPGFSSPGALRSRSNSSSRPTARRSNPPRRGGRIQPKPTRRSPRLRWRVSARRASRASRSRLSLLTAANTTRGGAVPEQ